MNKAIHLLIVAALLAPLLRAQEAETPVSIQALRDSIMKQHPDWAFTTKAFASLLGNPMTLNKYLDENIKEDNRWKFLKDIKFQFMTFTTQGSDSLTSLGFSYHFVKDINKRYFEDDGPTVIGQAVSLKADGKVAFDPDVNPENFLTSEISVSLFGSHGGVVPGTAALFDMMNALDDSLVKIDSEEDLDKSRFWLQLSGIVQNHLSTQLYWSIAGSASLEANQRFSTKQYVYGFDASLDVKAWNRQSVLAGMNVFDWPFAFLRWLSGNDADFTPLGSTIPTVIVGLKRVDPQSGDPRWLVDSSGAFYRVNLEAAFRTPVGSVMGKSVFFQADVRYYREIDPTPAIVTAHLHHQTYFSGSLTLANGMFISYSTGRLPFDAHDDHIYELGFNFSF
jgi:hypothetical protein